MNQFQFVWKIIGACLFLGLGACGMADSSSSGKVSPLPVRIFEEQIDTSCLTSEAAYYKKEVLNLMDEASGVESRRISISGDEADDCELAMELEYVFSQYWADPYIKEYFLTEQEGDTLIARIIPGREDATELQVQKIIYSPDSSKLLYVESHIQKSHQLFDMKVDIAVTFDGEGRYVTHELTLYEQTVFQQPFHVKIVGKTE